MINFKCQCGNTLYFANSQCTKCGMKLGVIPNEQHLSPLTQKANGIWQADSNGKEYKLCKNYQDYDICNWLVEADDPLDLCESCRLTQTIPNLSEPENMHLWYLMEQAKRRLLHSLIKLDLPVLSKREDPSTGLGFAFLQNQVRDSFGYELTMKEYVSTGHSNGLITINLAEAKVAERVQVREQMNEGYRTLIGHFRHESGHYYWDRLIKNSPRLSEFRSLFGDERLDYQQAMTNYYANGPAANWQNVWISAYATMHPWEDWAETWAHYLHMLDTIETASDLNLSIEKTVLRDPYQHNRFESALETEQSFTQLFNHWCALTKVLNALNRSMGLDDAYPFVISISALNKLRFVHQTINRVAN